MPVTEKTIRIADADIRLRETSGKGLPVLLIHGSGSSKEVFARQFESPLSDIYRLIAIDLPGHGQSSDARDPAASYTVSGLARIADGVLIKLGVERAAVFGWSLGGHVAIELLSFRRDLAGVMLSGAPPVSAGALGMLRGFHANLDMLLASKVSFTQRDVERFAHLCFGEQPDPGFIRAIERADGRLRAIVNKSLMRGDGADQKRTVVESRVPIAMVNGANDASVRLNYIAGLHYASLWEGRCHVIAGAGHAPFWQAPQVFNLLFLRFLADISARKSGSDDQGRQVHSAGGRAA
jgi:pimeloyl-ACP methyl ester carboxylesterase